MIYVAGLFVHQRPKEVESKGAGKEGDGRRNEERTIRQNGDSN